ncbi:DUF2975 domain-containing protein [Entomohabitans teleogrylli]|uniref:DUF2975 domain-containing protein n=1 Tax=Entomohabitans teleogrylli TaxID=1384589 RepID=UPI00073D820E|nr:DUF2975 domain-containing protein [Entomohabitans teleogrylli]
MSPDALAQFYQRMVTATMLLIVAVILLDSLALFLPSLSFIGEISAVQLSLSDRVLSTLNISLAEFPLWQVAGQGLINFLVLVPLCYCLYQVRALFRVYARRDYFSSSAAQHMRKAGVSLATWTVMTIISVPLQSYWLTVTRPPAGREILFFFELHSVAWLFISACIIAVAKILEKACIINEENKLFL